MASTNPIIEKLRKLMAHEQSARSIGSMAEAEAFAAKIQDLLTEYKLSMSEVEFSSREESEPIDWENVSGDEVRKGGKKLKQYWRVELAQMIARVNSCQTVGYGRRSNAFAFVGRTTDRELCKVLYLYLVELAEDLCIKCAKDNRELEQLKFNVAKGIMAYDIPDWANAAFNAWMKDYRESWKMGFSDAVCARLKARYEEALRNAQGTTAIVHINKDALAVKQFLLGKVVRARGVSAPIERGANGYDKGHSTGNTVNLNSNRLPRVPAARRLGM